MNKSHQPFKKVYIFWVFILCKITVRMPLLMHEKVKGNISHFFLFILQFCCGFLDTAQ